MKLGDLVNLYNRHSGKFLGEGKIILIQPSKIAIEHPGGSLTMVEGLSDPYLKIEPWEVSANV